MSAPSPALLDGTPGLGERRAYRAAALLLLVYPATTLAFIVIATAAYGFSDAAFARLRLPAVCLAVAVCLWRGSAWARRIGLWLGFLVAGVTLLAVLDSLLGADDSYLTPGRILEVGAATAAIVVLWRLAAQTVPHPRRPRAEAVAIAIECALMGAIAIFGFGFTGWHQRMLMHSQRPGIELLRGMGFCCGLNGGFVISDAVADPRWRGLTPAGIPALMIANTVCLIPIVLLTRITWGDLARWTAAAARIARPNRNRA